MSNFLEETRRDGEIIISKLTESRPSRPTTSGNILQLAAAGDKIPPHSSDAEAAVLGAIMLDRNALSKATEVLEPDSFYKETHRKIYEVMLSMSERNITIDLLSLSEELRRRGILEAIGGTYTLVQINSGTPTAANVEHYIRIVQEHALKRQLISAASEILARAYDPTTDALDEIDKAESEIFRIAEQRLRKSYISMSKLAKDTFATIASMVNRESRRGIPSGYTKLDDVIMGGFHRSDFVIIAARPSMGKTALALSIARNVAVESGIPTAFFSIEMSKEQLTMRLLSAEARVSLHKLMKGDIKPEELPRLAGHMDKLAKAPIYIDDSSMLSVMELRAKCRRLKAEQNIGLIIIDYLQLLHAPIGKNDSREREISIISRNMKQIAKELAIPVIALAQLNRGVEGRSDKRPMLSDLRESGSLEQDADVVMFVHRPEYYGITTFEEDGAPTEGTAEIIIGKQRNGPVGSVRLAYVKEFTRFENLALGIDAPPDYSTSISDFNASRFMTDDAPF
ncbi:MAG: replicative DNA helicase [Bacteroidota bacterium]|nr:replicative DNA helicase [Candidatus Kapabacteria bacterium]MDW8219405.1 replicative DNA helicase [Bacteroidota bacterium]